MIKKVKLADENFSNLTTLLVRHPLWHIRWHLCVCQNIQLSKARSLKKWGFHGNCSHEGNFTNFCYHYYYYYCYLLSLLLRIVAVVLSFIISVDFSYNVIDVVN